MTDQTIIDLFWQRSEDAIRNTSQKYGKYLTKIAMNILNYYEESEECVNDTYFAAWKQIPPDRPQKLLPYLGRITHMRGLHMEAVLCDSALLTELSVKETDLRQWVKIATRRIPIIFRVFMLCQRIRLCG